MSRIRHAPGHTPGRFGDSGVFIGDADPGPAEQYGDTRAAAHNDDVAIPVAPQPPAPRRGPDWPTVATAAGVAAIVSAVIVTIGIVGMHRSRPSPAAQPAVVQLAPTGLDRTDTASPEPETPPPSKEGQVNGATSKDEAAPRGAESTTTAVTGVGTDAEDGTVPPAPGTADPTARAPADGADDAAVDDPSPEPNRQASPAPAGANPSASQPPTPLPPDYTVTDPAPSVEQLDAIVHFLVATGASDAAKARNLEAGTGAVIVPKTVYSLGLFRAPRGSSTVTGPIERHGDRVTVHLHSSSAGMPDISMPIDFVYQDGNWKLASSSLCQGVKTVGLPIYCNA